METKGTYMKDCGAYAVIFDAKKERVGAVLKYNGYVLPGGKIGQGESDIACLKRTVGEELEVGSFLGKAAQFTRQHTIDEGLFYLGKIEQPSEGSQKLEWLNLHEAAAKMSGGHHQWAVQEGINAAQASMWF